ncbi:hypothetical protein H9Y04_41005 [Streptomyces sp. TRM66268-LWL]|uniref:Uncharacterized protein n=1 Tax=Streptomyces polyasparticus TaxID=2767826 RepID=A0ABR7STW2_9ACTN|nr:hypothetical protein [Streptomyces polyasparticus]MBC9718925.1 hypothetical protein [Streptomyces polyasparticus]
MSIVAPVTLLCVGFLGIGLYLLVRIWLDADCGTSKQASVNDVIKTTVTILTLIGAMLAGLYAYRKQLLAEGDAHRADASQLAERYTTAAEQLGHDQAAVRLAGVYALARLADDWASNDRSASTCSARTCGCRTSLSPQIPAIGRASARSGSRSSEPSVITSGPRTQILPGVRRPLTSPGHSSTEETSPTATSSAKSPSKARRSTPS